MGSSFFSGALLTSGLSIPIASHATIFKDDWATVPDVSFEIYDFSPTDVDTGRVSLLVNHKPESRSETSKRKNVSKGFAALASLWNQSLFRVSPELGMYHLTEETSGRGSKPKLLKITQRLDLKDSEEGKFTGRVLLSSKRGSLTFK